MRIDRITFRNFKCFNERTFELAPRFNLIIGDNGKGKTTVLDGLAVALGTLLLDFPSPAASRPIRRDEVMIKFYAHGETLTAEKQFPAQVECSGTVQGDSLVWSRELTSTDSKTTRQNADRLRKVSKSLHDSVADGQDVILPVISYYGTGRLWVQIKNREVKSLATVSRFMGYLDCLNPASDEQRLVSWFKKQEMSAIQRGQPVATLEACRLAILSCVTDATSVYFDVSRDQLILRFPTKELPFHQLSDGYRNMLAMVADIAVRCATLNPFCEAEVVNQTPGVILIDEIDLHLHPNWQRVVVNNLLCAFPNIQFVATTHSPFIIQSLPPNADVKLHNLDDSNAEGFANRSVEDIAEEIQNVHLPQRSRRFIDMLHAAEQYYRLLREVSPTTEEERAQLSRQLDELMLPFSDDPAYQAFLLQQREAAGFGRGGQE